MFCFAGYEFDPQRAELRGPDGEAIRLRQKAFDMLQLFAANPGRVLSKHDLIEAIWPNVHVSDDSLFQCVREIRAALGDDQRQLIQLVSCPGRLLPLPRTGRTHLLLATAYQKLGRPDEAKVVLEKAMELRPGSTTGNVLLPTRKSTT